MTKDLMFWSLNIGFWDLFVICVLLFVFCYLRFSIVRYFDTPGSINQNNRRINSNRSSLLDD